MNAIHNASFTPLRKELNFVHQYFSQGNNLKQSTELATKKEKQKNT